MKKKEVKVKKPIIKQEYEEGVYTIDTEQYYYNSFVNNEMTHLTGVTFDCCYFEGVTFCGDLTRVEFLDCVFLNCDFSNKSLSHAGFHRCEFTETKFIGTTLTDSALRDVRITTCFLDLVSFIDCAIGPMIVSKSNLKDSYFHLCKFKPVTFDDSDLTGVQFSETKLKGINVAGSVIDGIKADYYDLKGLVIDRYQAYEFCKYLDIEIE